MANKTEPVYLWTDKMCVASLVCGLLFFVPFLAPLLAILFGIIGLCRTYLLPVRGRGRAISGILLGFLVLMGQLWGFVALSEAFQNVRQVACRHNLEMIRGALRLYSDQNDGRFPSNLATLIDAHFLTEKQLICPGRWSEVSDGESVARLSHGNGSYAYCGDTVKDSKTAVDMVILYESPSNHNGKGLNCLCFDGQIFWISDQEGKASNFIRELEAGQNPPPSLKSFSPIRKSSDR